MQEYKLATEMLNSHHNDDEAQEMNFLKKNYLFTFQLSKVKYRVVFSKFS